MTYPKQVPVVTDICCVPGDSIHETCLGYATVNAGFAFGAVFFLLADRRCAFDRLVDSRLPIKECDISRDSNNHIVSQNLVTEFLQNWLRLGKQPKVRQFYLRLGCHLG